MFFNPPTPTPRTECNCIRILQCSCLYQGIFIPLILWRLDTLVELNYTDLKISQLCKVSSWTTSKWSGRQSVRWWVKAFFLNCLPSLSFPSVSKQLIGGILACVSAVTCHSPTHLFSSWPLFKSAFFYSQFDFVEVVVCRPTYILLPFAYPLWDYSLNSAWK